MSFDPSEIAVRYYFGDLQYWKLPGIAADALEQGYDGRALRILAALIKPTASDIRDEEIDAAFRDMGIVAPIPKDKARLILAKQSAAKAINGESNVFDQATYIRIHLCKLKDPPKEFQRIVSLSKEARNAPRTRWKQLETELNEAFSEFLAKTETDAGPVAPE
jgi:hypothetical protein